MNDDTQAKVQLYEKSVLDYEKLHHEITQLLSSRGGRVESLSDEEFAHYRELADLRDLAYNKMKNLEKGLLDDN